MARSSQGFPSSAPRDGASRVGVLAMGGTVQLGLGLLPIVPILLLPFILVFFVIVFPIWGVSLAVVGLLLLIVRGLDALARMAQVDTLTPAASAMSRAFRWVLTFGGLSERFKERKV